MHFPAAYETDKKHLQGQGSAKTEQPPLERRGEEGDHNVNGMGSQAEKLGNGSDGSPIYAQKIPSCDHWVKVSIT